MTFFDPSHSLPEIPELIEGVPNICGWEAEVQAVMQTPLPEMAQPAPIAFDQIQAAFAIALHMHQPTIPASPGGKLISNLQYMFEHPYDGDNHNAGAFAYCYGRLADFIPELVSQGHQPRVMLDYSGNLLWGLRQIGRGEMLEKLKRLTCDPTYAQQVEWLGTLWSHAIVPWIPLADIKLHIQAWQHHFAAIFGWAALARVRGFVAPELHLPNHPDRLYAFLDAVKSSGYQWLLVSHAFVETLTGEPVPQPHLPHRLLVRNSLGSELSFTVLIKTQGMDHQLVSQMQPYAIAKTLQPEPLGDRRVPPLVVQIADGENSGAMMNEFPTHFRRTWHELTRSSGSQAPVTALNGTEYLQALTAAGVQPSDYPVCQASGHQRLWSAVAAQNVPATEAIAAAVKAIQADDPRFSLDDQPQGELAAIAPTTNDVVKPIQALSQQFHRTMADFQAQASLTTPNELPLTRQARYRRALLHHLLLQTSCYRYWGSGVWTDYARDIYQRAEAILKSDF